MAVLFKESSTDMRLVLANTITDMLTEQFTEASGRSINAKVRKTTSGCPVIQIELYGKTYNITVTRSRNKP